MADDPFDAYVLEQLRLVEGVSTRRMFGGRALYSRDRIFGIVFDQQLYFRTDADSRADYLDRGMAVFRPKPNQTMTQYYEVPAEVLEDPATLAAWAAGAAEARSEPARRASGRRAE